MYIEYLCILRICGTICVLAIRMFYIFRMRRMHPVTDESILYFCVIILLIVEIYLSLVLKFTMNVFVDFVYDYAHSSIGTLE